MVKNMNITTEEIVTNPVLFVMFLHGVSYQSFSPFQVLNFYFDMERTNERGRSSSSRETLGRLGLFNCEEYFKYFYKGRQLIDRRLLCKEILYILNVSFPPSYIYKGSLPLTSKLENMKYLQVNVWKKITNMLLNLKFSIQSLQIFFKLVEETIWCCVLLSKSQLDWK